MNVMDLTPEQIDQWRWEEAKAAAPKALGELAFEMGAASNYRKLVRENVLPPAEPDQDTLDTRAVVVAYWSGPLADEDLGDEDTAKQALTTIKDRVRREAIAALPDKPSPELATAACLFAANRGAGRIVEPDVRDWLAAIKKVYGPQHNTD